MADREGDFSLFQGIHVRINVRIDISTEHLQYLTQLRLIKQLLVTLLLQDHLTNQKHFISTTRAPMPTTLDR